MTQTDGRRWSRYPARVVVAASVVVALPLVVALVALHGQHWHPVLDLAMTEFRVRDVGTGRSPLIGLPGRIGTYPNQGSHPGPLSFYALAPTYRLLGSSSWALQVGTVVIHVLAVVTALVIGYRRWSGRGVALTALLLAVVLRGYGQVALTQPWNPYLPLVAWVVVLLATWSVLVGDRWMLVPLVVAASFAAQTHVPYLPLGVGMCALALAVAAVRRFGRWFQDAGMADASGRARARPILASVVVGALLWSPPVVDQLRRRPGNIRQLLDHFATPPEEPLGVGEGVRLALRHLDVGGGIVAQLGRTGTFITPTSAARGALVLVVWLAAAAWTVRRGPRSLRALHAVVAVALALGTLSMARIFGRPWYYLTLWAWGTTCLLVAAVVGTVVVALRARRPTLGRELTVGAAGAALVVSLASAVAFANAHVPEERLSDAVGRLAATTYDAVVAGEAGAPGAAGHYLVRWSDAADIGSPGLGLLDELERRGLDVAADTYFHVPATPYRVRPRAWADAQLHLATGSYIERWREVPGAVEVVYDDPRTDDQRAEFDRVRAAFAARLADEGLAELVPLLDTNLFGLSTDVRLSAADQADLTTLIELGQPMAVFIAPPPSDADAAAP